MTDTAAIAKLVDPIVKDMGLDLVRIAMVGGEGDRSLQIMAERPDTRQLTLGDCEQMSRRISELLDAEEEAGRDPVEGSYRLEVSSPGIDRPLTRLGDFADWKGHEAKIALSEKFQGRRRLKGLLGGVDGETVLVALEGGEAFAVPFDMIEDAKLVLTDKLIKETAPLTTEGADEITTEEG